MRPTRWMVLGLALLVAVAGSGCLARVQSSIDAWRGGEKVPPPYAASYEEFVGPSHDKSYDIPVGEGASVLTVRAVLDADAGSAPAPPLKPAQVTLTLADPNGQPVGEPKTLSPQTTSAEIRVTEFPAFGTYALAVKGNGLSGGPAGQTYGAKVTLEIGVEYAPSTDA